MSIFYAYLWSAAAQVVNRIGEFVIKTIGLRNWSIGPREWLSSVVVAWQYWYYSVWPYRPFTMCL